MGKFGWSYPAGCEGTPFDEFPPCEVCGVDPDDCKCDEYDLKSAEPGKFVATTKGREFAGTHEACVAWLREQQTFPERGEWVSFTRRTDDPKLRYLERRLDGMGIPHRRHGHSWHAPILEVREADHERAYALLNEEVDMTGCSDEVVRLDDLPDDDRMFDESLE